jgi:PAS domain S-box-containing protein
MTLPHDDSTDGLLVLGLVFALGFFFLLWRYIRAARHATCAEAQLQLVLDHMKEGVVVLNRDRTIALMNTTGSRLISVPWQGVSYDLVERQFDAFSLTGEPIPVDQWPSSRALRGDFVQNLAVAYRNKVTGQTGSRVLTSAPVPPGLGAPGQVIISYRDDSERLNVDRARMRLAAIVECSRDAIVSVSKTGTVTSWNKGAQDMTGYSAAEMIGQSITRLLPPGYSDADGDIFRRVFSGESIERFETDRLTKTGRLIHVDMSISPMTDAGGEIIGASSIIRDITETRDLQRQLHQSQKMEAIGQLAGGIAHDFNNLLSIVIGNLELLEARFAGDPEPVTRLQTARRAAIRGADLTRHLLTFSSHQQLRPIETPLHQCIENMMQIAGRALGPEIAVSTNFDDGLPPVMVDPAGLESALLNLVLNARDAMPKGGVLKIATRSLLVDNLSPHVVTGALTPGRYVRVSVSDNGRGMSSEVRDRIFEPFFTTKQRGRGTGLGLPMVYGFARQSLGSVFVYSEPGYGTTVSLYLPLAVDSAAGTDTVAASKHAGASGTILLVDDEEDLLEIASAFLNEMGYDTLMATDADSALRLLGEPAHIDLIVTDIIMPGGINGVELAERVRRTRPSIKIIFTSGFPAEALAQKSLALDGGILLNKPYRLTELGDAVSSAMNLTNPAAETRAS